MTFYGLLVYSAIGFLVLVMATFSRPLRSQHHETLTGTFSGYVSGTRKDGSAFAEYINISTTTSSIMDITFCRDTSGRYEPQQVVLSFTTHDRHHHTLFVYPERAASSPRELLNIIGEEANQRYHFARTSVIGLLHQEENMGLVTFYPEHDGMRYQATYLMDGFLIELKRQSDGHRLLDGPVFDLYNALQYRRDAKRGQYAFFEGLHPLSEIIPALPARTMEVRHIRRDPVQRLVQMSFAIDIAPEHNSTPHHVSIKGEFTAHLPAHP